MTKLEHLIEIKDRAPKVHPHIQEQSAAQLEALDAFNKHLHGIVLTFKFVRGGQSRPYGDSVDEYVIFAYQPNSLTTGAPNGRWLSREDILVLARIFLGTFTETPQFLERRLESLEPEASPGGIGEETPAPSGKATCWRIRLRTPWND